MEVYVLTYGDENMKVYSSMEKAMQGYITVCKTIYGEGYNRAVRGSMRELQDNAYNMSEEVRTELMNFIQERPYKPVFTFSDLELLDTSFKFHLVKVD